MDLKPAPGPGERQYDDEEALQEVVDEAAYTNGDPERSTARPSAELIPGYFVT